MVRSNSSTPVTIMNANGGEAATGYSHGHVNLNQHQFPAGGRIGLTTDSG